MTYVLWGTVGVMMVMSCALAKPAKRDGGDGESVFNKISGGKEHDEKQMCDMLCSDGGEWCPMWCPEHVFHARGPMKRGGFNQLRDDLGGLNFEDYLFLKMLGRSRRR